MCKAVHPERRRGSPEVRSHHHEVDSKKKKKMIRPRDPLTELNLPSSSSSASSTSAEAPRGCFRFMNAVSRTPRSVSALSKPRSRPSEKKLPLKPSLEIPRKISSLSRSIVPHNEKNRKRPHRFCVVDPSHSQRRQGRSFSLDGDGGKSSEFSFKPVLVENGCSVIKLDSSLAGFQRVPQVTDTPAAKLGSGTNNVVSTPETTTPPLQASVSPEIPSWPNGDSSVNPACFGAGYVLAGVSDKPKCRPRGVLAVQENQGTCKSEDSGDVARFSFLPAPAEAAMNWIVSPNDDKKKETLKSGYTELDEFGITKAFVSEGLFTPLTVQSIPKAVPRRRSLGFEGLVEPTKLISEATPLSSGHGYWHAKSTENAVRRRSTELSSGVSNSPFFIPSGKATPSPSSGNQMHSITNTSPEYESFVDTSGLYDGPIKFSPPSIETTDVFLPPALSHEFPCPETSLNSIGKSTVQKMKSENAFEDASELRISWREGLVSMIYEMDELDCCQWSSEEEEINEFKSDLRLCFAPIVKSSTLIADEADDDFHLAKGSGTLDLVYDKQMIGENKQVTCTLESIPCAESISTDGNGLIASDSSDWTLCYKNQLFGI